MSEQNQIDWEKGTIQEPNQTDWENGQISQPLEKKGKGVKGHLQDTGLSSLKGAIAVPELAVGVMDMMSDGAAGKTLEEKIGFRPKEAKQTLSNLHTDQYKAQQQEFSDAGKNGNWADKVVDKTKVALSNPSLIANTVVESVPSMVAGGVLGRASGIANPVVAGAVGEGAVMAGSQAEQIRQETVDGRLTADQSLAGAATGVLGGLIGFAGGRLAQKMGIGDVDTMLVSGKAGPAEIAGEIASMPAKSLSRRMVEGAISEGFLEELPQSVSEQILQNLALDKPWSDGVEDAAVMGTLAGMAMGGGANILSGHNAENEPQFNQPEPNIPNFPSAPAQLSRSSDGALTGEYIPRADTSLDDSNQSRTAFVYDQPSKEADNLLGNNYNGDTNFNTSGNLGPSNNPESPLSPSGGNYFDNTQAQLQLPSARLGINPNDGPMSSAAAVAVDSGASPVAQLGFTPEQQEGNTPLSDAVPSNYQSLLDSQAKQSQIDYLEQQFTDAKSVPKKAEIRKQIDELKTNSPVTENQTKPAFNTDANLSVGSLPWSKDIASQALQQYQGDTKSLEQTNKSLTGKGPATDLIYYKNSPSFSNVEVVDVGDKAIVKLTNAKTGQVVEREYPQELARFNQFLGGVAINSQQENVSSDITTALATTNQNAQGADSTEGAEVQSGSTSSGQNTSVIPVSAQISKLEQQFEAAKTVPQKAKLRKQIDQLKLHQNTEATTQWQSMSPEQRQAIVQQIDTSNVPYANRLPNTQWDKIADSVKARLVGVMERPTDQIDSNAHEAATSPQNDLPAPTQAQIEASNYKKGHIKVQGLDIAVENPRGSTRSGKRPDGTEWEHSMSDHYGYIKRTTGADNEHIDTYIGSNPDSNQVFIVDQLDQESGNFDEHKVMLGFDSQEAATTAYQSNFDKGWKVGPIRTMDMEQFKNWLKNEDTSKPANEIKANSLITQGANVKAQSEQGLNTYTQIQSDSGLTHSIPSKLMDQVHKLGSIANDLSSIKTEGVKTNVLYGKRLLAKIAKLNPDVQVHIVSDLTNIKDKTTRSRLSSGGFYIPDQNILYIYPKTELWEGSVLELINHELIHTVTEQSITENRVSNENLDKLEQFRSILGEYIWNQGENLDENMAERLRYAYEQDFPHELLAVSAAETNVREVFKTMLGQDGFKQLDAIFTEISTNQFKEKQDDRLSTRGQSQQPSRDRAENISTSDTGTAKSDGATAHSSDGVTVSSADKSSGTKESSARATQINESNGSYSDDGRKSVFKDSRRGSRETLGGISEEDKQLKKNNEKKRFSRANQAVESSTVAQIREVLVNYFGEKTINELERQGKLEIIQDYAVDGVEGFYYNGKAVLIASNLTLESAVPTFLHELGGHAGFQNMMNQEQYKELMRQFDKLVEQGNPVAMAAKLLAEREQGSVRQQLEYLPYLLTLSSTMQQRNVIQRNALQKLIRNIIAYVKAWAFDRFGINLNLNPDDMLALSERMIKQIERQTSMDTVRQKYQGTSQWMTAPNGAKTRLTEQQWLQVRTPEFKNWFGDWENDAENSSQVLDENGEPKVVYHGTSSEFNEFRKGHGLLGEGIYLTDSFDTADMYANVRGENGFVLPLFVNIRNAFKTTGNVSRDKVVEATRSGKYQGVVHHFDDHEYIVALESNQVKMAEGNAGTFNSESADIRFSRNSNYDDITNRIANGFKNLPKTGDWINKKGVDWLKIGLGFLSRRHLTEVYGKLLPQLNKYNELAAQMDADKNDIAAEADNIVREWSKLKDEEALANVMHDATLAQIDPAKPHQSGDDKAKYQQLRHSYNNLSPEAHAMYIRARNAYSGHYAKVREAIRDRILRSALSSEKKADLLKKIEGSFGQIKGVYFPLARFGEYIIVMRNKNGDVESVSRAETNNEAESVRSELMEKYPQFKVDKVKLDKEYSASRDGVGRGFMSELFNEVENLGLGAEARAEFEDTLSQLYLSSMPDLSWAKHGIHRKGIAGFSQDARRAFAQHMFSGANYLGKLRYGDQLAQQLTDMQKHADDEFNKDNGYDQRSAQRVISEMEKRHELLMNPKGNPLSSFLTSVGFMYYMGLSPAAAMVNLSQTALIAYPIMGAKWGFDKAGKELLKASQDFGIGLKSGYKTPDFSSLEGFKNSVGDIYNPDIASILKGDELVAYEEAVKRGVIDVTQAHDLAGIAQGEDSKVMWYFRPAMRLASGMFHHAERFNREVTFIAAYRLARQHVNTNGSKATHSEAFEQAIDAVYKGHFDYSTGNRARFMQGNIAKVVLLFKQYAQNMIYTLVRYAHQSIYALDPKEQKEARRALAGIFGMTTLAAGAIGLPITGMLFTASILIAKKSKLGSAAFFAAWAAAFFGAADGDDDDPYELENVIRNWLADIHPKFADLVFGGVPRAFSPVDLSGRVGLNNLIFPDVQDGLEGADWAKAMQSALLGPVVGIGTNVAKGFQEINDGDYGRGIETMLPVVLKNAMKSVRFANEGVLTKNKDIIQEDVSEIGIFSQGIGFSPSDVKTSMEGRSAIFKYKTKLENHRKELMHKWVAARKEDDTDGMNKAWTEILKFNENVGEKNPNMRINRINLMQSYKSSERRAKETGDGGVYLTKRQKGAEEQGGFAFDH